MSVLQEIHCSHCGAPIQFNPGELMATCKYCGFTQVIETGETFEFEHSMILNKFDMTSRHFRARWRGTPRRPSSVKCRLASYGRSFHETHPHGDLLEAPHGLALNSYP